jgi:hypothetical protein
MTPHEQPPTMQAPQSAARRTFVLPSRPYRRVARADLSDSKAADAGIPGANDRRTATARKAAKGASWKIRRGADDVRLFATCVYLPFLLANGMCENHPVF